MGILFIYGHVKQRVLSQFLERELWQPPHGSYETAKRQLRFMSWISVIIFYNPHPFTTIKLLFRIWRKKKLYFYFKGFQYKYLPKMAVALKINQINQCLIISLWTSDSLLKWLPWSLIKAFNFCRRCFSPIQSLEAIVANVNILYMTSKIYPPLQK